MDRRGFLTAAAAGAAAMGLGQTKVSGAETASKTNNPSFRLKYAPHFNMFENLGGGKDKFIEQLHFIADQGFRALEDNAMMGRSEENQKKIAAEMQKLNLEMGVFVAYADFKEQSFVKNKQEIRDMLVERMKKAVEVAKRVNAKWTTVVLGVYSQSLEWDYQTANAIENLKYCAQVCEPSGLTMVLEPLNPHNHSGLFLSKIPHAYQICRAVGSPSCKILDDLYHQQVTEGNLISNMEEAWAEIAYIQLGDNPGRKEPTTGEINYKNIFKFLSDRNYQGILGMEHGNSKKGPEGEQAVLDAYRQCDTF